MVVLQTQVIQPHDRNKTVNTYKFFFFIWPYLKAGIPELLKEERNTYLIFIFIILIQLQHVSIGGPWT